MICIKVWDANTLSCLKFRNLWKFSILDALTKFTLKNWWNRVHVYLPRPVGNALGW